MNALAIALVIVSAVLHAGWNIVGKSHSGSGVAFSLAASLSAGLILSPYLLWYLMTMGWSAFPVEFWGLLAVSGLAQMVYLIGLIIAYKHADVGIVYPIARGLPVMMVGGLNMVLGYPLSPLQWLGFVLITLGCMLLPLSGFRQFTLRSYLTVGVLWAWIAAVGTACYSVIDKQALTLLSLVAEPILSNPHSAVFYLGAQFWAIGLPIMGWCVVSGKRDELIRAWQIRQGASLAGVMMAATYGLVLFAMTMTENVSLVVALRQISIVIGMLMGVWFLAEKWYYTRGVGVVLILCGILLTLG